MKSPTPLTDAKKARNIDDLRLVITEPMEKEEKNSLTADIRNEGGKSLASETYQDKQRSEEKQVNLETIVVQRIQRRTADLY